MCGICGFLNKKSLSSKTLWSMIETLSHRGPDDKGIYIKTVSNSQLSISNDTFQVGLGHRRLSIIDLTQTGHQPMCNERGNIWIVFNGEIYNFQEIREELQKKGYQFKGKSDTEVILYSYEQWGEECLNRFNGMFSFAVWDEKKQTLFLARDRLGIKPLYYYWDGKILIFASEIKAILASGIVSKQINERALWDYLTFRYVPGPQTIWQNIYKLSPGHTLTLSSFHNEPLVKRYWDIYYKDDLAPKSEAEYIEEFTQLFLDTVKLHLIADVPVGILLSGGIDSSSVAAAISEVHNKPLNSFSIAFKESDKFDELSYARQVAQHIGLEHNEIVVGVKEFMDFLPNFVRSTDEPLADLASVPLYYVSKLAKEKVKVILSGEGGDEILGGYNLDKYMLSLQRLKNIQKLPLFIRYTILKRIADITRLKHIAKKIENFNIPIPERNMALLPHMTNLFNSEEKHKLFKKPVEFPDSMLKIKTDYKNSTTKDLLHQVLYVYCQSWLVEDLLMKADKMTMANSVELRVPFLDKRIVEWAAQTPSWLKVNNKGIKNYKTKYILRKFAESRLPKTILQRSKQGFSVPAYNWLNAHLVKWANDILLSSDSFSKKWFHPETLRHLVVAGTKRNCVISQHKLWSLLIFEIWAREYNPSRNNYYYDGG